MTIIIKFDNLIFHFCNCTVEVKWMLENINVEYTVHNYR